MTDDASTATPAGARAHARSLAGSVVRSMPTVPASSARDLPPGVEASQVVWDETIGTGGYATRMLARGSRLRLTDEEGDACVGLLVYNADQPTERLNVADTVKVQWNAYLGGGRLLLSDMGRVLMSIVEDTCGSHDTFGGTSNQRSNAARYGEGANHSAYPNGRERFLLGLSKHGLGRKDVVPNINLFKTVRIEEDGTMSFVERSSAPGAYVELRAEMNVLVALTNLPHVLDERPGYHATPVRAVAWRGAATSEDDPIRTATPEALRAFQNAEDFFSR